MAKKMDTANLGNLREWVVTRMKLRGITQVDIAGKLDQPQAMVSHTISGFSASKKKPPLMFPIDERFEVWADALQLNAIEREWFWEEVNLERCHPRFAKAYRELRAAYHSR